MDAILADRIKPGDVLVIRYEGPKGGPGMQEMLAPTSALTGPWTIWQISRTTSTNLRPDFATSEGLVVTPSGSS